MIQRDKKSVFWPFSAVRLLDQLDIAYALQHLLALPDKKVMPVPPPDIDLSFLTHFGYSINTFITLSITNRITVFIFSSSGVHWSPCLFGRFPCWFENQLVVLVLNSSMCLIVIWSLNWVVIRFPNWCIPRFSDWSVDRFVMLGSYPISFHQIYLTAYQFCVYGICSCE